MKNEGGALSLRAVMDAMEHNPPRLAALLFLLSAAPVLLVTPIPPVPNFGGLFLLSADRCRSDADWFSGRNKRNRRNKCGIFASPMATEKARTENLKPET